MHSRLHNLSLSFSFFRGENYNRTSSFHGRLLYKCVITSWCSLWFVPCSAHWKSILMHFHKTFISLGKKFFSMWHCGGTVILYIKNIIWMHKRCSKEHFHQRGAITIPIPIFTPWRDLPFLQMTHSGSISISIPGPHHRGGTSLLQGSFYILQSFDNQTFNVNVRAVCKFI